RAAAEAAGSAAAWAEAAVGAGAGAGSRHLAAAITAVVKASVVASSGTMAPSFTLTSADRYAARASRSSWGRLPPAARRGAGPARAAVARGNGRAPRERRGPRVGGG